MVPRPIVQLRTLSASRLSARHFMDPALMRLSMVCGKMLAWVDVSPMDGSTRQMTSSSLMLAVCVCLTIGKVVMRPSAQTTINNENSRVAPDASTESVRNVRCHPNSDQTLQVKRDGSLMMPHSLPDGKGMGAAGFGSSLLIPTEHTTNELCFQSETGFDFFQ